MAWQLPAALVGFFGRRSYWSDWILSHRIALDAAERAEDVLAQARSAHNLAIAYYCAREFDSAIEFYVATTSIAEELVDDSVTGMVLIGHGTALQDLRRFDEAVDKYKQAIPLWRAKGNRLGEGLALRCLGDAYREMTRYGESINILQEALAILGDEAGYEPAVALSLLSLGAVYNGKEQYAEALSHLESAREMSRKDSDPKQEGLALFQIGLSRKGLGQIEAANECFALAMVLFGQIGDEYNVALVLVERGQVNVAHGSKELGTAEIMRALDMMEKYEDGRARYEAGKIRELIGS